MSITTTVVLVVMLSMPGRALIDHEEAVGSLSECWAMAGELTARAEEGPLRRSGGKFWAGCRVEVKPSEEH